MSQITDIVIKTGLVSQDMLQEFLRWRLPLTTPPVDPGEEYKASLTLEALCLAIETAIQSEGYVLLRETDLEAIQQYIKTMQPASLHVVAADASGTFAVQVGRTATGDFIIPWRSDSITDMLTNGETYLEVDGAKVFFSNARELFYGQNKAFTVCTPSGVS